MSLRSLLTLIVGCSALALVAVEPAHGQWLSTKMFFDGGTLGTATDYGVGANWGKAPLATGSANVVPAYQFQERALIGTDGQTHGALLSANVVLGPTNVTANVGGIYLAQRALNTIDGTFLYSEPAPGTMFGRLTITNNRSLTSRTTTTPGIGADGRVMVGVDGRGELILDNGNLTILSTSLQVGGEEYTDPNTGTLHRSLLSLRGDSDLILTGVSPAGFVNLDRDLRIEGPNVTWTQPGRLTLGSTNRYTAVITSPTAHSAMNTTNLAVVNGSINVEFSGAGSSGHAIGETWDLVHGTNGIAGTFNNLVGVNREVPVTGLTTPNPAGTGYRLQTAEGPGEFEKTLQLVYQAYAVLVVNRDTGQIKMTNPHGGHIDIDAYTIRSARGSMTPGSFTGIHGVTPTPPDTGWVFPANNTVNAITEIKTPDFTPPNVNDDSFDLFDDPNMSLGNGFSKTAVAANVANFGNSGEDLIFEYTGPNGDLLQGLVTYEGTKFHNNLVLRVNPTTGNAFLKNDSQETLTFDGYEILSTTSSLNWNTFTGLGGSWEKSPAQTPTAEDSLTNTNPIGSTTLAPGASLAIGDIGAFTTQAQQDGLSMNFILKVGLESAGITPGDFDEDGDVDGEDFLLWQVNPGVGDLADWELNYGTENAPPGPETEFRPGSILFDNTAGLPAAIPVPEPCAALLMLLGMTAVTGRRRRTATECQSQANLVTNQRQLVEVGASTMARRLGVCVALLATMCVVLASAAPAAAVTGGATMTNIRFALPGPVGEKVVAFDPNGVPIPGIIPGWTFGGPGMETFSDPNGPGDSGTEGSGATNPDNELLLSTLDGLVWQTSATPFFPASQLPSTQQYVFSFTAREVFTIGVIDPNDGSFAVAPAGHNRLSGRITYGDARNTLLTFSHILTGTDTAYQIVLPYNSAAVVPAFGQKIGIEFDNTSIEWNTDPNNDDPNNQFTVAHAWNHVDDVILEITGVLNGDLNGNGTIGLDDYAIIRDNQRVAADYLAQGDLVRDGIVDLKDFRAWTLLPGVISSGVLERLAQTPEPTSLALAAMVGAIMLGAGRHGRKITLLIVVCAVLSISSSASAELLLYDPFLLGTDPNNGNPAAGEYNLGSLAVTSEDGGSTGNQAPIVGGDPNFFDPVWKRPNDPVGTGFVQAQGLSFLGAPAAGGSMRADAGPDTRIGRYLKDPWTSATTGTRYISFLANFGGDGTGVGHRMIEFWGEGGTVGDDGSAVLRIGYGGYNGPPNAGNPQIARMFMDQNPGSPASANKPIIDGSPASFAEDAKTHLIVVKLTLSDVNLRDRISLYLNPTDAQEEPVIPSAELVNVNFTLGAIGGMVNFGAYGGNFPAMDELRVATTFTEAMPDLPLKGDCCGDPNGPDPNVPDDFVDIHDYNAIFANLNLTGVQSWQGDVNGDGDVTIADYRIWKDNRTDLGGPLAGGLGNVPEPSAIALSLLGALAFGCARRRK